jgi:hypothetical protein
MATSRIYLRGAAILRAQREEERARRLAERQAAKQSAQAAVEAFHAEWLDRQRAAAFLGLSVHQLKRLAASGRGPAGVKRGTAKQAPIRWHVDELRRWKAAQG